MIQPRVHEYFIVKYYLNISRYIIGTRNSLYIYIFEKYNVYLSDYFIIINSLNYMRNIDNKQDVENVTGTGKLF